MYTRQNFTRTYTLPDGNKIYLDTEMFEACELLFQPNLSGLESGGIHLSVHNAIQKTDIDLRNQFYKNIVLSGGTTLMRNLDKRLHKELNILKPINLRNIDIIAPSNRDYSVWLGGSVLSSLDTFRHSWITKSEYQDSGVKIIHKKCM